MVVGIVVGVVVVLLIFWYVGTYNGIKVSKLKVEEALSGIDVALTKRYDVLVKMLDVVKGYQKHEKELLMEIVNLRSGMSMQERNQANQKMNEIAGQIRILAENYPELKSSNNFIELQKTIVDVEEHLQAARRLYNANVTEYNKRIITFPNSIVANIMNVRKEMFFAADEAKRADVKMDFHA